MSTVYGRGRVDPAVVAGAASAAVLIVSPLDEFDPEV
jgi:hypothetical protein